MTDIARPLKALTPKEFNFIYDFCMAWENNTEHFDELEKVCNILTEHDIHVSSMNDIRLVVYREIVLRLNNMDNALFRICIEAGQDIFDRYDAALNALAKE